MRRRMRKKEIELYEKRIQKDASRMDPKRKRKFIKVLSVLSANWAQHTALFTEEFVIIDKEFYDISECSWKKEMLIEKGYVNNDGKVGALLIDYGKINYGYVNDEKDGLVPIFCKPEDIEKYRPGQKITVYVVWSSGYDGTLVDLYMYNMWENHVPMINFM